MNLLKHENILLSNDVPYDDRRALVWVIDGECLFDIALHKDHAEFFLNHDEVLDISKLYPEHSGLTVRFMKNNEILQDLQTTEYFGSILLSEPTVLHLEDYPYGRYVTSPYAKFDGEKFIILNMNMEGLKP